MPDSFDPYYKWFGIPPKDQPPNHYRLLGLELFEGDPDVIESAADRQMAHLRSLQSGPHGALSQKLLNEVSAARLCLLDPAKRRAYDELLRSTTRAVPEPIVPPDSSPPTVVPRDMPTASPVAAIHFAGLATQAVSAPVVPSAASIEEADQPRRPFWQEPVILGAVAAGLLLGTAAVGVLMLLPLGKPAAEDSYRDIATVRAAAADRINAASFAGAGDDVPQTAATQVMNAEASLDLTANGSQSRPAAQSVDSLPPQAPETIRDSEPQPAQAIVGEPNGSDLPSAGSSSGGDIGLQHTASSDQVVEQSEPEIPEIPANPTYKTIGKPVNLLATIDLDRDVVNGMWRFDGKNLISPERVLWARVMMPYSVPDEYVLTVVFDLPDRPGARHENFNLGLVAGGTRQFMYCVTAFGNGGLFLLNGKEWHVNETSHPDRGILIPGENIVACTVRTDGLEAKVNGRTYIDWKGNFERLSLQPAWQCPLTTVLFLGTCCDYRFTKVELQRIRSLDGPQTNGAISRRSSRARKRGQRPTPP